MKQQDLSHRLSRVGAYVTKKARLADIGSDHAYLPITLMLNQQISYAVAGEVVQGPFLSAEKQVKKNGLTDTIKVRLADGLDAIYPEDRIDTITIAGMGGTLICSILQAGQDKQRINGSERLILQANVGEKNVREWIQLNGYTIIAEEIIEENKKIYEIIVAEKQAVVSYSEKELFFGPLLLQEKNAIFLKKWQHELLAREKVLQQLEKAEEKPIEKVQEIQRQMTWMKEVLR